MAKIHARIGDTFHTAPRKRDLPQNLRNVTRLMLSARNRPVTPVWNAKKKKKRRDESEENMRFVKHSSRASSNNITTTQYTISSPSTKRELCVHIYVR